MVQWYNEQRRNKEIFLKDFFFLFLKVNGNTYKIKYVINLHMC